MKALRKRGLALLLALLMLVGVVACNETVPDGGGTSETGSDSLSEDPTDTVTTPAPKAESATDPESETDPTPVFDAEEEAKHLRILAIGNSFSVDGMEYLWDICKAAGIENVTLGNLYIGGCTLAKHWTNISGKKAAYKYNKNTAGSWVTTEDVSVQSAMQDEYWDVITVQQASGSSGLPDTYGKLGNILGWIEEHKPNPEAKILWHMTWAYQSDSDHKNFPNYDSNQMTMYEAITSTVQSTVLTDERIDGVIPSGTAIQNLRTSYVGDTVTRDGYHLHKGIGRYTAGLVWFSVITGRSVDDITWVPDSYKGISTQLSVVKESVKNALQTPYAVTDSTHKTAPGDDELMRAVGLDPAQYELLDLQMAVNSYYNSTKQYERTTTGDTPRNGDPADI